MKKKSPQVAVIMGSISDWKTMKRSCDLLKKLGIEFEKKILSAHRTPDDMRSFAQNASENGTKVIIAGAGGAAHLPGMTASYTILPVIGVPIASKSMQGLDSLLSIAQMPKGIPVATVAVDNAENAALLAAQIISLSDLKVAKKILKYRSSQKIAVVKSRRSLK